MTIQTVGVIGAGVMGSSLTQALIENNIQVVLVDISEDALEKALMTIDSQLRIAKMMKRLDKSTDLQALKKLIHVSTDLNALSEVDFVVENIVENWEQKESVYQQIDTICQKDCIFAANTSAISITKIAALTQRPQQVIGMHFMNPVPQKSVIETIRGVYTSAETIETSQQLLAQMNKKAIVVNDYPGFVSNRISHLFMNEAIWVAQDQVADFKDIDEIFVKCYQHDMGPLATADLIGLDTVLETLHVLYESYLDPKFRPAPLLVKMVAAGKLGRKSGEGFFSY